MTSVLLETSAFPIGIMIALIINTQLRMKKTQHVASNFKDIYRNHDKIQPRSTKLQLRPLLFVVVAFDQNSASSLKESSCYLLLPTRKRKKNPVRKSRW